MTDAARAVPPVALPQALRRRERVGALTVSRSLGQVIGLALLGSLVATTLASSLAVHGAGPAAEAQAFTDVTRRLYQVGLVLALATLLRSIGIPELPLRRGRARASNAPRSVD